MTQWPQYEVHSSARGRILAMDSVGYVDERNDVGDVLICGSHGAPCAAQLAVWLRPRGLFLHDAGIGLGEGGAGGLKLLDAYLIPGAAVDGASARISDGRDMYENGTVSRINSAAAAMGLETGMTVKDAAQILLDNNPKQRFPGRRQITVQDDETGRVFALDTVKYADSRIAGGVLCMGSHAAAAMANYVRDMDYRLAGVITNDAGMSKDNSGVAGLAMLDEDKLPAAAVSCSSARVGDAVSTFENGRISACNETAVSIGIAIGQPARQAADLMLQHAAANNTREKANVRAQA